MAPPPLDRRSLLRIAAGAALASACGCSSGAPAPRTASSPSAPLPSPPTLPSPPPSLAPVARWTPSARESLPAFKQVAADVAQALCTRARGQDVADALAAAAPGLADDVDQVATLAALAPLGEGVASSGEVVYPQFGGLDPIGLDAVTGAAMVVVRQTVLAASGTSTAVTRTLDLRLRRDGQRWSVTALRSAGGEPVDRPAGLPPVAAAVLDDPRVVLPDTARWDVHAGRVSLDLLALLSGAAAAVGELGVVVLQTGHPREVFGTGRTSDHTVGRAADVWRVGATAVVDDRSPGGPSSQLQAAALLDPRVRQVGSPPGTDLDGVAGRRTFENLVHEDHLHLAVRT